MKSGAGMIASTVHLSRLLYHCASRSEYERYSGTNRNLICASKVDVIPGVSKHRVKSNMLK